jgi:hypothetical protein
MIAQPRTMAHCGAHARATTGSATAGAAISVLRKGGCCVQNNR